jgi:hypothetical protein
MRVRRRSGQLYCRQRHHCVATNPPQHRTIACTRDTYRSLQTFSTLLGSRNLQSTLLTCLLLLRDCLSAGMLSSRSTHICLLLLRDCLSAGMLSRVNYKPQSLPQPQPQSLPQRRPVVIINNTARDGCESPLALQL